MHDIFAHRSHTRPGANSFFLPDSLLEALLLELLAVLLVGLSLVKVPHLDGCGAASAMSNEYNDNIDNEHGPDDGSRRAGWRPHVKSRPPQSPHCTPTPAPTPAHPGCRTRRLKGAAQALALCVFVALCGLQWRWSETGGGSEAEPLQSRDTGREDEAEVGMRRPPNCIGAWSLVVACPTHLAVVVLVSSSIAHAALAGLWRLRRTHCGTLARPQHTSPRSSRLSHNSEGSLGNAGCGLTTNPRLSRCTPGTRQQAGAATGGPWAWA